VNHSIKYSGLCVILSILLSCATSPNPIGGAGVVEFYSETLKQQIHVEGLNSRVEDGLLTVSVTLRNLLNTKQAFEYKFIWFSVTGYALKNENDSWGKVLLYASKEKNIKAWAPSPEAKRFKIQFRDL